MDTAVALFQKKFFFGRQLCLQPVVTSPPGENGRWNTRNTRNKERGGGGKSCGAITRFLFPWNHYRSLPLIITSLVTTSHRVQPRRVFFLSLSLRLSSNFPSLSLSLVPSSMSRCHGDATSFNCETFPPQYEAMNQRGSRSLFPFNYKIFAISLRFDNVAIISMFSFSCRAAFESFQISFRGEKEKRGKKSRVSREPVD